MCILGRITGTISLSLLLTLTLSAQVIVPGSALQQYRQLVKLKSDSLNQNYSLDESLIYNSRDNQWNIWGNGYDTSTKSLKIFGPEIRASYNSAYARSYNDGPVWKGRGITTELHAGVYGKTGILHYAFVPTVFYSQNNGFELSDTLPGRNTFNYQYSGRIDYVQRYGTKSFAKVHPGQSELRLIYKKFTLGASTQNFSFGPSYYNPIIMSKNAPGFPHVDIGTSGPVSLRVKRLNLGKLHSKIFYGLLKESPYFDANTKNNTRYFTGITLSYTPPKPEGLTLGFNRAFIEDLQNFEYKDLFRTVFYFSDRDNIKLINGPDTTVTNDLFDQLGSFFFSWKFQDSGLRIYAELAKNDFNGSLRDFMVDLDHSRAYTIGLEKSFDLLNDRVILLSFEHTTLARNKGYLNRPVPPYYTHHIVHQGYTQDGQLLAAGIGPGSNTDNFTLTWYSPNGSLGLSLQRIRFDDDYFYTVINDRERHSSEYSFGLNGTRFINRWSIGAELLTSYRYNYNYIAHHDKVNVYFSSYLKYHF